jgi:hypothetical protein
MLELLNYEFNDITQTRIQSIAEECNYFLEETRQRLQICTDRMRTPRNSSLHINVSNGYRDLTALYTRLETRRIVGVPAPVDPPPSYDEVTALNN